MFHNTKLRTKLITIGVLFTIIPLIVVSVILLKQNRKLVHISGTGNTESAYKNLDSIALATYALCQSQQEVIQENINSSLNVAHDILQRNGKVFLNNEDKATWKHAINQYTKSVSHVELPKMMVGETWLGQNAVMSLESPIVDKVKSLFGGTCTIFQRMNDEGDMLRVCTNVEKTDGTRAIGTFIPRTNPDGTRNPVVDAVLKGQTFRGRAYVVNKWYITAYEPLYDENKHIIGMLYVGVPQESVASLRQSIMDTQVGRTGYIYVLDSQGNYVISKDGKRDGENIWDSKDSDGTYFIQEICKKAVKLKPGELAEQWYPWKNAGDKEARMKIARIAYFEPWDWVIGVGSYNDEFFEDRNKVVTQIQEVCTASNFFLGVALVAILFVTVVVWFLVSRGIVGKINRVVVKLTEGSEGVFSAAS